MMRTVRDGTPDEAVAVLAEAFADYPVMAFVAGAEATQSIRTALVRLFVMNRALRQHPIHVIEDEGVPVGAMTLTPPAGTFPDMSDGPRAELDALIADTWGLAGAAARARYDAFVTAANAIDAEHPNWHVNMVGVLGSHQGRGLARVLLDVVHARSANDPASRGVSLTTELPANVGFYEYLGYEIVGERSVDTLTTWSFFRPDDPGGNTGEAIE